MFIRGGDSDSNKVLLDGVSIGDLGGRFDFGPFTTTAIERAEVYRGPDSSLYGADAASGVVSLTTPHGTTSFPSVLFHGDGGNFMTSMEDLEVAGAHNKLDYLGEFNWLQTANNLPNDEFHVGTAAANVGWQPSGSTQIRGTVHYGVDATGVPNAWQFYHVADNATQKDQDIYLSASIDNQTTADFHNLVRYGLTRKREQYSLWQPSGQLIEYDPFDGYSADSEHRLRSPGPTDIPSRGRRCLISPQTYPFQYQLVSNRDQVMYQGDYRFTPHLNALIGFHYEDERGSENIPSFFTHDVTERTNYDYLAAVHGDFKNRFFYTLGGSLEHYSLFGVQTSPRAGFSVYALRPRKGIFSGTRILFNYGDAVREPALTDQFGSLYQFLVSNGYQSTAQQLHIAPLAAPTARTYEGGVEQSFLSERIIFRASYFHNQFGREIESVGGNCCPISFPTSPPRSSRNWKLRWATTTPTTTASPSIPKPFAPRESSRRVEGGIGRNIFMRGGYTYLQAAVQRSFDSDNEAFFGGYAPTFNGIPIGRYFAAQERPPVPPAAAHRVLYRQLHGPQVHCLIYIGLCQPQRRLHLS